MMLPVPSAYETHLRSGANWTNSYLVDDLLMEPGVSPAFLARFHSAKEMLWGTEVPAWTILRERGSILAKKLSPFYITEA